MSAFSIFQASFDGALRPQHRRKARWAAYALTSAAVALVGGSLLTVLHLSSTQLSDLANAGTPRDIRLVAEETARQKPCAGQSWPFMEGRCLIDTTSLRRAERSLPRRALAKQKSGSQEAALVARKKRARAKTPDSGTLIATRSRTTQTALNTTGVAPRNETTKQEPKVPDVATAASSSSSVTTNPQNSTPQNTSQKKPNAVVARHVPVQPRREARHKELTREQREARAEARSRRNEIRSASRWNDGGYYGGGGFQQRGFFDGFFSTIR